VKHIRFWHKTDQRGRPDDARCLEQTGSHWLRAKPARSTFSRLSGKGSGRTDVEEYHDVANCLRLLLRVRARAATWSATVRRIRGWTN
jgi:hypothetical protein